MMRVSHFVRRVPILASVLLLLGCASTQLNYNTLDIAATVDTLVTRQVLSNLAKFIESPHAIPSQVALTSGTITTNNTIVPAVTSPLNISSVATNSVAQTVAAASSRTLTTTTANTRGNVGATLTATDQWTQTWGVAPLTDPDQLRRLRVLYRYGADQINERDLLCDYPVISNKAAATQSATGTFSYPTSDGNGVTVTIAPPKPKKLTRYLLSLTCRTGPLEVKPDPSFLNEPSCIICAGKPKASKPRPGEPEEEKIYLFVNPRLRNHWLKSADSPFGIPAGAIQLGHYQHLFLYVDSEEDLQHFYEFSLFVLEATAQAATSATGQSAGKGGPTSTAPLLLAPAPLLQ